MQLQALSSLLRGSLQGGSGLSRRGQPPLPFQEAPEQRATALPASLHDLDCCAVGRGLALSCLPWIGEGLRRRGCS